ncbi:hypothetical protein [Actinomadura rudentiformis]|uniref:hypothetical protein n=1 Tax=Actinomadura rudentiformis TaxID=359158 RepID=UPI00178C6567|nr:hypothetical protein [Actinomadura rudentiformis]
MSSRRRSTSSTADATVVAEPFLIIMLVCIAGGTALGGLTELAWEWATTQTWGRE